MPPATHEALEIQQLRATIRDLVALAAVPAAWTGREPARLIDELLALIIGALRLDAAYIRFVEASGDVLADAANVAGQATRSDPDVTAAFTQWLAAGDSTAPLNVAGARLLEGLHVTVLPIGLDSRFGTIVAASSRDDFPNPLERVLLEVAATQAGVAVDNARLHEQARAAIRDREEFLSVAAHELRTPLTSLSMSAQLAVRQIRRTGSITPEQLTQRFEMITQQADKLNTLVARLLDVSRVESEKLTLETEPINLAELVAEVVAQQQLNSEAHQFTVRCTSSAIVLADSTRLEQVLINLLDNAVKYSPNHRRVEVEVTQTRQDYVDVRVRDHGIGIPPEQRDRIFDRFFQAHAGLQSDGMGLGLYISRHIVVQHGGELGAEFPPDGGSCFVISLPVGPGSVS